jgi:hypothetical protein
LQNKGRLQNPAGFGGGPRLKNTGKVQDPGVLPPLLTDIVYGAEFYPVGFAAEDL